MRRLTAGEPPTLFIPSKGPCSQDRSPASLAGKEMEDLEVAPGAHQARGYKEQGHCPGMDECLSGVDREGCELESP